MLRKKAERKEKSKARERKIEKEARVFLCPSWCLALFFLSNGASQLSPAALTLKDSGSWRRRTVVCNRRGKASPVSSPLQKSAQPFLWQWRPRRTALPTAAALAASGYYTPKGKTHLCCRRRSTQAAISDIMRY